MPVTTTVRLRCEAFWQNENAASLIVDLLKTSPDVQPLDAVRDAMVKHISRYTTEQMTAIDNLMRSNASLLPRKRKQAFYAELERALFAALCEVWRQPERRTALKLVAMVAVGTMRLALQTWAEQSGQRRPVAKVLRDIFESLRSEL